MSEHRISWINNVGGDAAGDDASPLLSTSTKPYRTMIEAGTISVFDFRIYLFARQAEMLFRLGRTVEVAKRGAFFVSTFARTLREHQVSFCVKTSRSRQLTPLACDRYSWDQTLSNRGRTRRVSTLSRRVKLTS